MRQADASRISHSISSKLNRRLFLRLLGLFICINMAICGISTIVLWLYFESKVEYIASSLLTQENDNGALAGLPVISIHETPIYEDAFYNRFSAERGSFLDSIRSITYAEQIRHGGTIY